MWNNIGAWIYENYKYVYRTRDKETSQSQWTWNNLQNVYLFSLVRNDNERKILNLIDNPKENI